MNIPLVRVMQFGLSRQIASSRLMVCMAVCVFWAVFSPIFAQGVPPSERAISIGTSGVVPSEERVREGFLAAESAGLFVGVREFRESDGSPSPQLIEIPYAADDAVDLAYLFAMELKLIEPRNVQLALSGEPQKPESAQHKSDLIVAGAKVADARFTTLLELITKTKNAAGEKGLVVMAFATHGFTYNGDRLLGQDSKLTDLDLTGLPVARILDDVAASKAQRRLVLVDACRERISKSRSVGDSSSAMAKSFSDAIAAARGQVVLSSTVMGGMSYDDPALKNGVFTSLLIRGLRGEAMPDERGFITPETLAEYLDAGVREWVDHHRSDHKDRSRGIGYTIDDKRSGKMPLAVNAKARENLALVQERVARGLEIAKRKANTGDFTWEIAGEVIKALESDGDYKEKESLCSRLERLDREGADYAEDLVVWWQHRGRRAFGFGAAAAAATAAVAAAAERPSQPAPVAPRTGPAVTAPPAAQAPPAAGAGASALPAGYRPVPYAQGQAIYYATAYETSLKRTLDLDPIAVQARRYGQVYMTTEYILVCNVTDTWHDALICKDGRIVLLYKDVIRAGLPTIYKSYAAFQFVVNSIIRPVRADVEENAAFVAWYGTEMLVYTSQGNIYHRISSLERTHTVSGTLSVPNCQISQAALIVDGDNYKATLGGFSREFRGKQTINVQQYTKYGEQKFAVESSCHGCQRPFFFLEFITSDTGFQFLLFDGSHQPIGILLPRCKSMQELSLPF